MTRPDRIAVFVLAALTVLGSSLLALGQDDGSAPGDEAATEEGATDEKTDEKTDEPLPDQVKALQEKVLESKARLLMLPEEVYGTTPDQAALKLVVANELSGDYRLTLLEAKLDGEPLLQRELGDDVPAAERRSFVHEGPVAPGAHHLDLALHYRGNGYGIFPYMKGYQISVTSAYTFVVPDSVTTAVTATVFSESPLTREWKDRPRVRFDVDETRLLPRNHGVPPSPPGHTDETPENE